MRRSSSLLTARLTLGMVAAGAAAGFGCKGTILNPNVGHVEVYEVAPVDGGVQTTFDCGQACVGFSSVTTLALDSTMGFYDVTSIAVTGNSSFYSVTQPANAQVAAGSPVTFTVTFAPPLGSNSVSMLEPGKLVITTTGSDNSPLAIDLTANVANAPAYSIFQSRCVDQSNPDAGLGGTACMSLTFDATPVFGSSSQPIFVTNLGCPPLDLSAMLEDGGDPTFSFSGVVSPLPLGQTIPVSVTFSPVNQLAAENALTFNSPYPDAGLPQSVTLIGAGIAPTLEWDPSSWGFPGAVPGQLNCETFTLTNDGSATATVQQPIVANPEINGQPGGAGAFVVDGGWPANTMLAPGGSVMCTVCADLPDAGVTYTAQLEASYVQNGSNAVVKALLLTNSTSKICTNPEPAILDLPDDHMFCGVESGTFQVLNCDGDGGACVTVTSFNFPTGGNFENLLSITNPPGGPPWTICPGDAPLTVGVTFRDNGLVRNVSDTVDINSSATGQAIYTVTVVPVAHPVPVESPEPTADGGSATGVNVFDNVPYTLYGLDDGGVNFEYVWYYLPEGPDDPPDAVWIDGGEYDVIVEPQNPSTGFQGYMICVEEIEVDAGFGNCGLQYGGLDAGDQGQTMFCSSPLVVAP